MHYNDHKVEPTPLYNNLYEGIYDLKQDCCINLH